MIDVSVIVPVYNVERYMTPSVETILKQTHKNIEIILVDDGSTDASGDLCEAFARRDPRVQVIHKENGGVGYARNTGMDAARGEYLYFCDPDDLLDPSLIADNLKLARAHRADIVEFGYRNVYCGGNKNRSEDAVPGLSGVYSYREFCEHFPKECVLGYPLFCRMYRRAYIEKNGLRQTKQRTGEDALFIFETYRHPFERIVYNPKIYYDYMRREGTANTRYDPMRFSYELAVSQGFEAAVSSFGFTDGRYDRLVDKKYVTGFSIAVGNLSKAPLSLREKIMVLRKEIQKGRIKIAVERLPLKEIGVKSTRLKVLLLKWKCYRLVVWLGEQKVRAEKLKSKQEGNR